MVRTAVDILSLLSWSLLSSSPMSMEALSSVPYSSWSHTVAKGSSSRIILAAVPGADIEQETNDAPQPHVVGQNIIYRGKVNEIDYCIAPADVSLSRAYIKDDSVISKHNGKSNNAKNGEDSDSSTGAPQSISLTQALNNASNRAVRRILLAKCWPSEEKLNLSLRLAAAAEKQAEEARKAAGTTSTAKCPVPRPILNLLMRRGESSSSSSTKTTQSNDSTTSLSTGSGGGGMSSSSPSTRTTRTMEQYVEDQINAFRERYGSLAGYKYAEAYLEAILSLATTGKESPRVKDVSKVFIVFACCMIEIC
jgi:hypothetical protein